MQLNQFSPQLTVAELLGAWPQTIPVFIRYHLDCVGCSMAAFETLAEVIGIYRLPGQQFLADLESSIREDPRNEETFGEA